jgi:hypothetical protein
MSYNARGWVLVTHPQHLDIAPPRLAETFASLEEAEASASAWFAAHNRRSRRGDDLAFVWIAGPERSAWLQSPDGAWTETTV